MAMTGVDNMWNEERAPLPFFGTLPVPFQLVSPNSGGSSGADSWPLAKQLDWHK